MKICTYENENMWIYEEFKNLAINCGRTINRFIQTMITLSKKPSESIAAASKDKAEAKAIVRNENVAGEFTVEIPRDTRRNNKKRDATLEVKYAKIAIPVPLKKRNKFSKGESIEIYLILAKEKNEPKGIEPIEWFLITNVEIASFDETIEKIRWYTQRWKIERFHYILKSGCKIEELQEEDATQLSKLILMYSIIAARILCITYLAREEPDSSCETMFQKEEWKVLYRIANKTPHTPQQAPTMKEAVSYIAKLGGFLGRKGDGDPGVKVVWRGLKELNVVLKYYKHLIPT